MTTTADIKQMLENATDYMDKLTKWELLFVESVTEQLDRKGKLTERQIEILTEIDNRLK